MTPGEGLPCLPWWLWALCARIGGLLRPPMGLNPARTRSFHAYRFCTVHGNELYEPMWPLEALICLWGGCPLLNTGAECSALPPEAVWGRTARCRGAYGVPANLFSYGSFPLDCPRGITGCRWRRECVLRCQIAGFDELSKRVPQPPRGVELTAVGGRRGWNGSRTVV